VEYTKKIQKERKSPKRKEGKKETHVKSSFPPLFIMELKTIMKKLFSKVSNRSQNTIIAERGVGSPYFPAVTVDTAAKPSTTAPDVTRKHEKKNKKKN
jgi:hypothetical protein